MTCRSVGHPSSHPKETAKEIYALKGHFSGWLISTEVQGATPKEYFILKDMTDPKLKIKDLNTGNDNNIHI